MMTMRKLRDYLKVMESIISPEVRTLLNSDKFRAIQRASAFLDWESAEQWAKAERATRAAQASDDARETAPTDEPRDTSLGEGAAERARHLQESTPTTRKRPEGETAEQRYERLIAMAQKRDPTWKPLGKKWLKAGVKARLAKGEGLTNASFDSLWKKAKAYARNKPGRRG
jgi:hypothetical protein